MHSSLGDIAEIASAYPVRGYLDPDPEGSHWAVMAKDIDTSFRIDASSLVRVTPDTDPTPYLVREGDLLFLSRSRYGAAAVYDVPQNSFAVGSIFILRVDPSRVHPKYLAWYFALPETQRALRQRENAGKMPFLRKSELSQFAVPVPPLDVQQTIAAVSDLRLRERQLVTQLEHLRQETVDGALLHAATKRG